MDVNLEGGREGIEAARVVDYDAPEFVAIDELPPALTLHTISTSSWRRATASCV